MKNYIILFGVVFLLFSCTSKTIDSNKSKFTEVTRTLTSEEQLAIESVKKEFREQISTDNSRSFSPLMSMKKNLSELDNFKLSTLPFYDFDTKKFYEDPSPERLMACMVPSNKINVFAEQSGNIKFYFSIKKEEEKWTFDEYIDNWGNVISWLPDSLENVNSQSCKIFIHGNREYVTYKKDGKDLYFRITGEYIPTENLCEQFVEEYNQWLKNTQFIRGHPDMFNTSK